MAMVKVKSNAKQQKTVSVDDHQGHSQAHQHESRFLETPCMEYQSETTINGHDS
jgi:hypothetical protein